MMLAQLKWPLTVLLSIALVAVAVIVAGGDALGIDPELRSEVMQALKTVIAFGSAILLPLIVLSVRQGAKALAALLEKDEDGDGIADVFQPGARKRRPTIKPPPDQGAGGASALLLACLIAASTLTSACSPSAFGTHYQAVTILGASHYAAVETVDAARTASLDRVEAEHPTDPEHDAAVDAEGARWRPVGHALDLVYDALGTWMKAIKAAQEAGSEALLPALLVVVRQIVALYVGAVPLAADVGVTLPALPAFVTDLLGGGAR